ncbi:hypothetical protein [Thiomicrorhabdus aquaedulcis]|uniref:hypothetical protein n=1 Tax=Thiomicrorhabdus aquaedulcis TaxID=2211106 RepID=UPI000FDBA2ED|nr:hypothetical protein [Thiomicrorhabdus aquaedulcis]
MHQSVRSFKTIWRQPGLLSVAGALLLTAGLSGCSTFSDGVDSVGRGIQAAGDALVGVTGHVKVEQVDETHFRLTEQFHEPITTFDSLAMRSKAKQACPKGYVYESRKAYRAGEFATSHNQCETTQACGYELEWRIMCDDVPYEPFTLFGKT